MNLSDWLPANSALTFVHPWLLLLLLLHSAAGLFARKERTRRGAHFLLDQRAALARKNSAARAGKFLRGLFFLSLALLIVAMARPQLGKTLTQVEASGIDIMLVLDVSQSMLTKDFTVGGDQATRARCDSGSDTPVHRRPA